MIYTFFSSFNGHVQNTFLQTKRALMMKKMKGKLKGLKFETIQMENRDWLHVNYSRMINIQYWNESWNRSFCFFYTTPPPPKPICINLPCDTPCRFKTSFFQGEGVRRGTKNEGSISLQFYFSTTILFYR